MQNLTATFLLHDVKVPACINIEGFRLEPVPENPNDTYLRFDFTHTPNKDSYSESQKEIQPLSFVLSVLYKIGCPEPEDIVDKSAVRSQVIARSIKRNPAELEQTDLDKIEKAYKKVKSMTGKDKEIFNFVARWVQKASGSRNVYDKFISYWIAFNFLYGRMQAEGERQKIEKWVKTQCDNAYASKVFDCFQQSNRDSPECKAIEDLAYADADLDPDPQRTSPKVKEAFEKLRRSIKDSKFDVEALRYLAVCIYGVRNSIFHGYWSYLDETRGHVGGAEFLLYKLIRRGLEKQCNFAS